MPILTPIALRRSAGLAAALVLAGCLGDSTSPGRAHVAQLAFAPVFQTRSALIVSFTRVRIVLSRGPGAALDTTVDFPPGTDSLELTLLVPIRGSSETLALTLAMINAAGDTVFRGGPVPVTAITGVVTKPTPVSVAVRYVGVGANARSVRIAPRAVPIFFGDSIRLTATALDSGGQPIPGTPIIWRSLDAGLASVPADTSGKVIAGTARGVARIEAALLTAQTDTAQMTVEPVPAVVTVQSGGSQTAAVGAALPQPVTVRVKAADNLGVSGVAVNFAVTGGTGTVTSAVDTTDANGDATTGWTLGSTLGTQSLAATLAGSPGLTATISATAVVGSPKQLAFQIEPSNVAANAVMAPALQVVAQDAFGHTVTAFTGNVTLALGANPGSGSLAGTLTVAAVAGVASFGDLALNQPGAGYTLVAGSSGLSSATSAAFSVSGGVAAQLAFVQQPTSTTAGTAITPAVTVQVRDANGNVVPTAANAVTVAIGANPGGGTLTGTATVNAVAGIATYTGLSIDKTGAGYALTASAGGLAGATSGAFNITAGAASQLAFTTQPATTTAGVRFGVVVTARDAQGNAATGFAGNVAVAITGGTGKAGAALRGTTTVAAVAGVASFSGLSVDSVGAGYTLTVSATGPASSTSASFAITAAPATRLVFTTQPTNTTAGSVFAVAVTARDSLGNTASAFTSSVAVAITSGTGKAGAALRGTTTLAAVAGIATFGGLSIDSVGTGYTLTATATGPSSATSASFDVAAALANRLAFTTQPVSTTAGVRFGVAVTARDSLGNTAAGFTGNVTVAITGGTGKAGAALRGTTSGAAVAGVATFAGLSVDSTGSGYTLTATASGATGVTSSSFNVSAAPASKLAFTTEPPASGAAGTGFGVVVTARDSLGNTATAFTGNVAVAVTSGTGKPGAALRGSTTVAAAAGVATFAGLSVDSAGTGYTLTATASGTSPATSSSFAVTVAPASQLAFTTEPPANVAARAAFSVAVTARDSLGNAVTSFTGSVSVAIAANPASGTLSGTLTQTAVGGVATFSGLAIDNIGSGYTLRASAAGLTSATSTPFNVQASGNVNAWVNPAGGNWSVAGNWSKGTVPVATDTVTIAQSGTYTVNLDANAAFARLDVGAPSGTQTLSVAANTLTAGNGAFASNTVLSLSGSGTITGGGTLAVSGAFSWTGGSLGGASGAGGTIQILAGGTLSLAATASVSLQSYTLALAGTGTWTGTATVNTGGGAVLRVLSGGALAIQGDPTLAFTLGGASPLFENLGTINRTTSTGIVTVSAPFSLGGTVSIQSGAINVAGGGTMTGAVTLANATALQFTGGSTSLANNFRVTGATGVTQIGGLATVGGLALTDTAFFDNLQLNGGTLSLAGGTIKTPISLMWAGPASVGGGTLFIPSGAALSFSFTGQASLQNATILNAGAAVFTSTGELKSGSGAVIRNLPGATFAFAAAGGYSYNLGGTPSVLDNQGTLTSAPASGAVIVSAQFSNSGTLQVASDTLRLSGGSTGTFPGAVTVTTGAVLEFGGGTFTQGAALQVGGNLLISGGLAVLNGHSLGVAGNFATRGTGALQMAFPTDSLEIGGSATFGGGTGTLSNGVIRVAGNFTQTGGASFAPGPNTSPQRVVLTGNTGQIISFANPTLSFFRRLQALQGPSGAVSLADTTRASFFQWSSNTSMPGPNGHFIADTITGTLVSTNIAVNKVEVSSLLNTSGLFQPDTAVFTGANQGIPNLYGYHTVRVAQSAGTAAFLGNPTAVLANLVVSSGTLDLTGRQVRVSGSFRTEGTGTLRMTGAGDSLGVGGNATFGGGSTTGRLSAGVISVGGNFSQGGGAFDAFAPSTAERVLFNNGAGALQTISFANPTQSFFDSLVVDRGFSPGTVQLLTDIRVNRGMTIQNSSNVTGSTARATIIGGTLRAIQSTTSPTMTNLAIELSTAPLIGGSPVKVSPDTMVYDGTIAALPTGSGIVYNNVRANTLAALTSAGNVTYNGDLIVSSGTYTIGSGVDSVGGFLRTEGTGALSMVAIAASPTVAVRDSVVFAGGPSNSLTGGLLRIWGNFVQRGAGSQFAASGTHRVAFQRNVAGVQTIQFADPTNSFFHDLLLNPPGPGIDTVRLVSSVQVQDSAIVTGFSVLASTTLEALHLPATGVLRLPRTTAVLRPSLVEFGTLQVDSAFVGGVTVTPDTAVFENGGSITSSSPAYGWKSVRLAGGLLTSFGTSYAGNLIISGGAYTIPLGPDSVGGFLRTEGSGVLQMTNAEGETIAVRDSAVFSGGSETNLLTGGNIRIYGSFVQRSTATAFAATSGHTTIFAGSGTQTVTFTNPGASASTFGNVAIERSVLAVAQSAGITLGSDVFVAGSLQDSTFNPTVTDSILGNGFTVNANSLSLGSQFVMNNAPLVTNSTSLFLSGLTFRKMSPTVTQWTMNVPAGQSISFSGLNFQTVPTTGQGQYFAALMSTSGTNVMAVTGASPAASALAGFYTRTNANGSVTITWNGTALP